LLEPAHHLMAHPEVSFSKGALMFTSRLDRVLPPDAQFDFLNIDIQGAELRALRGLGSRIKQLHWIYAEVNVRPLYAGCALLPELDKFLRSQGFVRAALLLASELGWGDALYFNRSKFSIAGYMRLVAVSAIWRAYAYGSIVRSRLAKVPILRFLWSMRRRRA